MTTWLRMALFCLCCLTGHPELHAKELPDFTELVEKQGAAVVNISTSGRSKRGHAPDMDESMLDYFHRFFPRAPRGPVPGAPQEGEEQQAMGSGFIISADGFVLTNTHVVDGAERILVRLTDKRELKARLIGADRRTDVALLKIDAKDLPTVSLGDPHKLKVGEWVVAIGAPFGFENSVTAGIVSAKGRELPQENLVPFIQTDVAINPGNSGGPLFNMKGQVVGMNSQIYSRSGGYMGVSFAIPIDVALDVQNQLRQHGRVSRGRIGVAIQEVSKELADSFGLPKPSGALVASVEKGSPADKAGVETGDIVLKFDGKTVHNSSELPRIVTATRPGSKVSMQLWRKGSSREVSITVAEFQDDTPPSSAQKAPAPNANNPLGLSLSELSPVQKQQLGVSFGLLVQDLRGPAARGELQRGDVLLSVIHKGVSTELKSVEQFNRLMAQIGKTAQLTLLVKRGDSQTFITLRNLGDNTTMKLQLFGHLWCHLCDDMQTALAPFQQEFGFELDVIDAGADEALEARFGERVPVLVMPAQNGQPEYELCHYFLDAAKLRAALEAVLI